MPFRLAEATKWKSRYNNLIQESTNLLNLIGQDQSWAWAASSSKEIEELTKQCRMAENLGFVKELLAFDSKEWGRAYTEEIIVKHLEALSETTIKMTSLGESIAKLKRMHQAKHQTAGIRRGKSRIF